MIIVSMHAGLGNQMFQYAFYRELRLIHKDVKMDIATNKIDHSVELRQVFNIEKNYATIKEIEKVYKYKYLFLVIPMQKLLNLRLIKFPISQIESKNISAHNSKSKSMPKLTRHWVKEQIRKIFINPNSHYILDEGRGPFIQYKHNKDVYYDGCWQSVKYFEDVINCIHNDFTFKRPLKGRNKKLHTLITKPEICSVSIHIRKGDYLTNTTVQFNVVEESYYEQAIIELEKIHKKPIYIVFSDDIGWVKENLEVLKGRKCIYVDWNKGEKSYIDMQLMSCCKHNIIANSTFSWWGAFLNKNKDKLIWAPSTFYKINDSEVKMIEFPKDYHVRYIEN